jgi:hypothetical protein
MIKADVMTALKMAFLVVCLRLICWVVFQVNQSVWALWGLTFDPISKWLADFLNQLVFPGEKLAPSSVQVVVYDLVLILGFGTEVFLLSILLLRLWARNRAELRT